MKNFGIYLYYYKKNIILRNTANLSQMYYNEEISYIFDYLTKFL